MDPYRKPPAGRFAGRAAMPLALVLLALVALPLLSGCGPRNALGRMAVSGRVTLDKEPLDHGTIMFTAKTAKGIATGGPINEGKYEIVPLKGLPPGSYLVQIRSTKPNPADKDRPKDVGPAPGGGLPGIERVAARYNLESELTVEVAAGKEAHFDFEVFSK